MSDRAWRELLSTLDVQGTIRPSTSADLAEYESASGFVLPESYREYCLVFGAGTLAGWEYVIAVPACDAGGETTLDGLEERVREFKTDYDFHGIDVEQFKRGKFFCEDNLGNSLVFWDPAEVTSPSQNEYGVYVIYRDYSVERLCDTFTEFVTGICLGRGFPSKYDNSEDVELVFRPL